MLTLQAASAKTIHKARYKVASYWRNEPAARDRDTARVARQTGKQRFGTADGGSLKLTGTSFGPGTGAAGMHAGQKVRNAAVERST